MGLFTEPSRTRSVDRWSRTLQHALAQQVRLTAKAVVSALCDFRRGAAGLSGMRTELTKLLLEDLSAVDLLTEAAIIADSHTRTRLTALRQTDGGARGVANRGCVPTPSFATLGEGDAKSGRLL